MQAVVLVGGEGTRLRPLTLETPKPMVPVMNVPFLERTLRRLKDAGIDDVILPAGYLPEAITSYFGDGSKLGLAHPLRHRGDAARHRRRAEERPAVHQRSVLRPQRRRPHEPRSARDARRSRAQRRHRQPAPHPSRGSVGVRLRRPRRGRSHHRVRREAAARTKHRPTRSTPEPICSKPRSSTQFPPAGRCRSSAKRFRN